MTRIGGVLHGVAGEDIVDPGAKNRVQRVLVLGLGGFEQGLRGLLGRGKPAFGGGGRLVGGPGRQRQKHTGRDGEQCRERG